MKAKILLFFSLVLLVCCTSKKKETLPIITYVPDNASIILKINDFSSLKSEIKNNTFLKKVQKTKPYTSINQKLAALNYLQPNSESILAISETKADNFEFLFITKKDSSLLNLDNLKDKTVETITSNEKQFTKITLTENVIYQYEINNYCFISSTESLLHTIKEQPSNTINPSFQKIYEAAGTTTSATLFINTEKSNSLLKTITAKDSGFNLSGFSDWLSLDIGITQNLIHFSGIGIAKDTLKRTANLFKNTKAIQNKTPLYTPQNASSLLSYTFEDYNNFNKNRRNYLNETITKDSLCNAVEELGVIYLNKKKAVVLLTHGSDALSQHINAIKKSSLPYNGNEILEIQNSNFLNNNFTPLITDYTPKYCAVLENNYVLSKDLQTLKTILDSFNNGKTFDKTPIYKNTMDVLGSESSVLFISKSNGAEQFISKELSNNFLADFKKAKLSDYGFAGQIVADNSFFHANFSIQKVKKAVKNNTTSAQFTVQLDNDILTNPQFVTNHRTFQKEIVIQDQDFNLYLISNKGKVLWKKQLKGQIQGKVEQVDIYKNGKLQLAFTTDNQFLILDRNGKEVLPFNKPFEGGNLNPIAVFDYDKNKDYRFLITQGQKTFMYNNKGNIVKGFKFTSASSPILKAPKHFRINRKDYLVFMLENGDLKILNRTGKERIRGFKRIDFSNNEIYLYKNKFSITDKKGTLHQIDTKGKVTKTNFNASINHNIDATSKTLALMDENTLNIKGKKVTLAIGVYSKPKIFYLNDKIYVSVTDLQNQKTYLFDSNAKAISGFPVYGSSIIDLDDVDNKKKPEIIVKDTDNSLVLYNIN